MLRIPDLHRRGQLTLQVIVFSAIAITIIAGFAFWADANFRASYRSLNKFTAFNIAEAGIEYYRWHLAHASQDYWDGHGATSTGPYIHAYYDKAGNRLGQFELTITPPTTGSTVVTLRSVGKVDADTSIQKSIRVRLAIPSYAKYAVVANAFMRFGAGTETFGPLQSNGGIRFDGYAHNLVSSAMATTTDPDSGLRVFGVHTEVAPIDPTPTSAASVAPNRPDIFGAGRQFPVATTDFFGITQDLAAMRSSTRATGFYVASTSNPGYEIILNTNHTFTLNRVTSVRSAPSWCSNSQGQTGWGTWSVSSTSLIGTYPYPTSGVIYVEAHAWVRGQINGDRLTIVSGLFPDNANTRTSITLNNNVLYTNYDGRDALGLVAQNNINVGLYSADTIRIDGALIAQNGRIGRYYYGSNCSSNYIRQQLTSYGMLGSNQRYGFAYSDGTGYQIRNLIYDPNLLYAPPPSFPLTTDQYQQISWEELL